MRNRGHKKLSVPKPLKPSSGEARIESVPFGVLFGVEPWNFPYYQRPVLPCNLMAGNVVMVKQAECSQCAIAFEAVSGCRCAGWRVYQPADLA